VKAMHLWTAVLTGCLCLPAQDLKEFEKKITEFTLANGLHFILMERHEAPVVSFHTYVNAGSVDDPSGSTGIAHMFEHMAFKGTETIGTTNWPEEKKAIAAIEAVYDRLEAERNKGPKADAAKIKSLQDQVQAAAERAQAYVVPNEYPRIIEENGGAGLNASTSFDSTEYFYSLPSNRIELWFLLESQRFLQPVFREFYKERAVVLEENRMRVQSSPQGKLLEAFLAERHREPPDTRCPQVFRKVLCAREHHDRDCGRREPRRSPAHGGTLFWPLAGPALAADSAQCGTSSTRAEGSSRGFPQPAAAGGRVQTPRSIR
jgi:hypothetical protein